MKIPEGYDEVTSEDVDKKDCLSNKWIGSSSKTILEENC